MISRCLNGLIYFCLLIYPLVVYVGLTKYSALIVGLSLAGIFLLRILLSLWQPKLMKGQTWFGVLGLVLVALFYIRQDPQVLHIYPVLVNMSLLGVFGFSLFQGGPMIERFARLRHPDLPRTTRPYFHKLTLIWCGFFLLNGGIAAWTVYWGNQAYWALYNGLISYLLMATLAVGEFLYRKLSGVEKKYA